MAATTMEKITSLVHALQSSGILDTPHGTIALEAGASFSWHYQTRVVTYDATDSHAQILLLHEVGHALLNHQNYDHDIHLLEMERAAWDKAQSFSLDFGIIIDTKMVEDALDTYRDWLHARSLCPQCSSTGVQTTTNVYMCLACHHVWRVNEARTCQLRRYNTKKRP